eukprot:CAMPEP_0196159358 /NCGR_PEP_ID=MMETSP0910-20130528/46279_1 /TAXON_ID=49265 /ORGANISM="Thalassiosira rotula, Strain GSO102" /LENGTH=451 /DNA_ID=CAMNT_0041424277 /DNA_START=61 /DNA_END=1416 /DNA_ORIENTATION=-
MSSDNSDKLPPPPKDGIPFNTLPWNLNLPDEHSYIHLTTTPDKGWTVEHYDPETDGGLLLDSHKHYSSTPLPLYPSTTSLNYGTTIWEGLACRRSPTSEKAIVFRPQKNYARFVNGAKAMCLPAPSYELFMRGLQLVLQENAGLIPPAPEVDPETGVPQGGAKLYIRPMLLGSGQQLGLHASPQISLLFFVSPTGSYFSGKTMGGLKLHLERRRCRAARGGTGNVKCCGNYAVTMRPLIDAQAKGFNDNLYLELDTYHNPPPGTSSRLMQAVLQELSAANIFLVLKTGEIVTPGLKRGTILPGVTRDTILTLASEFKDELRPIMMESIKAAGMGEEKKADDIEVTVSERDVTVGDLLNAAEVFVTGTAAEVVPVQSIGTSETPEEELDGEEEESFSVRFPHGETSAGPVTTKLLEMLREVLAEKRSSEATKDWLCDVYATPGDFRKGGPSS